MWTGLSGTALQRLTTAFSAPRPVTVQTVSIAPQKHLAAPAPISDEQYDQETVSVLAALADRS